LCDSLWPPLTDPKAMLHSAMRLVALVGAILSTLAGCNQSQQRTTDSAAGAVDSNTHSALSVIDVGIGRRVDTDKKISDATDTFAPTDTIYASVHTSGAAKNSEIVGRWTFQDGTVVDERKDSVTISGDGRTVFMIMSPAGLPRGTYTLHVLADGKEVRTKDATVK
jgi:hypothetical protein